MKNLLLRLKPNLPILYISPLTIGGFSGHFWSAIFEKLTWETASLSFFFFKSRSYFFLNNEMISWFEVKSTGIYPSAFFASQSQVASIKAFTKPTLFKRQARCNAVPLLVFKSRSTLVEETILLKTKENMNRNKERRKVYCFVGFGIYSSEGVTIHRTFSRWDSLLCF